MKHVWIALVLLQVTMPAQAQKLLIPMDLEQTDHLKAYGLAFWALEQGIVVEWLLNYRGGAFLLSDTDVLRREGAAGRLAGRRAAGPSGRGRARLERLQDEQCDCVTANQTPDTQISSQRTRSF